jgi:hypothetical protein
VVEPENQLQKAMEKLVNQKYPTLFLNWNSFIMYIKPRFPQNKLVPFFLNE